MEHIVFEGTWEDAARRAAELAGHRVRITVLDTPDGITIPADLLDEDAAAVAEAEAGHGITLQQVRAATATIRDSMARAVIEDERAERF